MMSSESKIKESTLCDIWYKKEFTSAITTIAGDEIEIIDSGTRNEDSAGPDFRNARIRIGNLTYVGDIEIDRDFSDWKNHGHNIDNNYNSVVLHSTLINKYKHAYVYTRSGRIVPTVCMYNFIDNKSIRILNDQPLEKVISKNKLKCFDINNSLFDFDKEKYLTNLGLLRFKKRCTKIFSKLKELQYINELHLKEPVIGYELTQQFHEKQFKRSDFSNKVIWQQLLLELIFEALGYSKNKAQMIELTQHANINFLNKIEQDGSLVEKYEATLFTISGLLVKCKSVTDAKTNDYIEKLRSHWALIKKDYDGIYMDDTQWHFFRLRPQNFPTIRIAAGAKIVLELLHGNLINIIAKKITEIHNLKILINSLRSLFVIKSSGYWKNHFVFDQQSEGEINYFVGASRADEIVVNVILPFYSLYFEIFGNASMAKKILKIYTTYEQKSENQILTQVASALNIKQSIRKTVISQGMIDLFRNYCSKNKCLECEIGKAVFN